MPETAWKCDVCSAIYPTEDRAVQCEESHVASAHMALHRIEYDDGGKLPSSITFRIDPEMAEGNEEFLVRYVFDVAGVRGI